MSKDITERPIRGGALEPVYVARGSVEVTTQAKGTGDTPDGLVVSGAANNI